MTLPFARACTVALVLAVSAGTRGAEPALEPGDVVFQTSRSAQSLAIQEVTASPWSHVGIVDVGADGPYVIEAIGHVSRTPWRAWRARGRSGRILVLRARLPAAARARAVAAAGRFLGRPYDPRFEWGDDRLYCSELVAKAYLAGAGRAVGKRERLRDLRLGALRAALAARYGGRIPWNRRLVTPASIAADPLFYPVYGSP
ncbi:YiiX/YebB-like N1pC/P60 family cysteine hydrolase [Anaeromyxobacter oryzisoli]|uniref:YiiX/YebB-like N1pC/P60 family cysteine hydrolase n=1 Tax=Anaeromyxobacter oryzisoli TaxID=2925408 RepID=UPI001F5A0443|nr:YiiX/YebB-like N1pC/P60 family cysteine hydrolase [Anaeromyxobacter sp. SG63]